MHVYYMQNYVLGKRLFHCDIHYLILIKVNNLIIIYIDVNVVKYLQKLIYTDELYQNFKFKSNFLIQISYRIWFSSKVALKR